MNHKAEALDGPIIVRDKYVEDTESNGTVAILLDRADARALAAALSGSPCPRDLRSGGLLDRLAAQIQARINERWSSENDLIRDVFGVEAVTA